MLVTGETTERELYSNYRENMKKLQIAKERRSLSQSMNIEVNNVDDPDEEY